MSLNLPARRRADGFDTSMAVVNIVLLLIFFFLVSGQQPRHQTSLQLAGTTTLPSEVLPSPVLEVRGPDDWLLDGQRVVAETLPAALAAAPGPVHLMIDRTAPAAHLTALLAMPELQERSVLLVTEREISP